LTGSWLAGSVRVAAFGRSGGRWSIVSRATVLRVYVVSTSNECIHEEGLTRVTSGNFERPRREIIEQGSREKEDKELYADLLVMKCCASVTRLGGNERCEEIGRCWRKTAINLLSIQMAAAPWVNRRCRFIASVTQFVTHLKKHGISNFAVNRIQW
jgi:hypothetical protein